MSVTLLYRFVIFLYDTLISFLLFSEVCAKNEFRCNDFRDECISLSKVCDLNTDCLGGEDEKNCGNITLYFKHDDFYFIK